MRTDEAHFACLLKLLLLYIQLELPHSDPCTEEPHRSNGSAINQSKLTLNNHRYIVNQYENLEKIISTHLLQVIFQRLRGSFPQCIPIIIFLREDHFSILQEVLPNYKQFQASFCRTFKQGLLADFWKTWWLSC